jgi:prepilin-type N-terminal cleavage/methylation domain-containing protein
MSVKSQKNFLSGFTLIETLVAISILSIAIAATFTSVTNGIRTSTFAKEQITQFYLVQEAMEYVRNIRDQNALNSIKAISDGGTAVNWLAGLATSGSACEFGKTCTIDAPLGLVTSCSGGFGTCPYIRQDTGSGLFGYTPGWPQTEFQREIQFQSVTADQEVLVKIKISWTVNGIDRSFQITESLLNHQ